MTRNNQREAFEPGRDFTVVKAFRCEGMDFAPGQTFDKTRTTTRRLQQLYEQGRVRMQPEVFILDSPVEALLRQRPDGSPDFAMMSMDELRQHLADHGVVARPSWDRGKLLEKIAGA